MKQIDRLRIGLTILATLAVWSLLVWQHFHGGVPAHYLLQDPNMPRLSDWWGGLLLPALTWLLLSLSRRRMMATNSPGIKPVVFGLVAGVAIGLAMSISFMSGRESITSAVFFSLVPLALILPVYRPECLLGFFSGMSVAFGFVLPIPFGLLMALVTFIIHRFIGLRLLQLVGWRTRADHATEPVDTPY